MEIASWVWAKGAIKSCPMHGAVTTHRVWIMAPMRLYQHPNCLSLLSELLLSGFCFLGQFSCILSSQWSVMQWIFFSFSLAFLFTFPSIYFYLGFYQESECLTSFFALITHQFWYWNCREWYFMNIWPATWITVARSKSSLNKSPVYFQCVLDPAIWHCSCLQWAESCHVMV